jgi:DNA helicase-2/ATP-dependent DNA helicase PcrA
MIQIWQGSKFEWDHEIFAQKKIIEICQNFYDSENAHLVFSFRLRNVDFDFVLFTKNRIIIIELKKFRGFVTGGESGKWQIIESNGIKKPIDRNKNPFEQCSICRSVLNKELREFLSSVKVKNIANSISSGIVSYPEGYPKEDGRISGLLDKNPWFFYENLSDFLKKILKSKTDERLPLNFGCLDQFIRKHLNCKKEYFSETTEQTECKDEFDAERVKAVTANVGTNSIVIAGPGSGKTRYIIDRAKYLINSKKIIPENIAFVTFTNEAANEIKRRLYRDLSLTEENTFYCIGTIHRICLQILEYENLFEKIGYKEKPKILSSWESKERFIRFFLRKSNHSEEIIRKVADFYSLSINRFFYNDHQLISKYLSEQKLFYDKGKDSDKTKWYLSMIDEYILDQRAENVIDFDSILLSAHEILSHSNISSDIARKCKYIFLDELQDISKIQFKVFQKLADAGTLINAVGDPAQGIYGFRGGDVKAFDWLNNWLKNTNTFFLSYNFRSNRKIVRASEKFKAEFNLFKNLNIRKFECLPTKKDEGSITIFKSDTETREATSLAKLINELIANENDLSFNDVAVLYRNRRHLNPNFGPIFNQFGIPFVYKDRQRFSEKPLIKKILTVLNFIYSKELREQDISDLFSVSPFSSKITYDNFIFPIANSISDGKSKKFDDDSINKLLSSIFAPEGYSNYQDKELKFFKDVLSMRANADEPLTANILYFYEEIFPNITTIRDSFESGYEEDVFRLLEVAENFKVDYESFLKKIKMEFVDVSSMQGVTISTMHGSKGCEWEVVFLTGLNDFAFNTKDPDKSINQEDNIFYVAMTRAKSKLFLSYSEISRLEYVEPSKYLSFLENYINN